MKQVETLLCKFFNELAHHLSNEDLLEALHDAQNRFDIDECVWVSFTECEGDSLQPVEVDDAEIEAFMCGFKLGQKNTGVELYRITVGSGSFCYKFIFNTDSQDQICKKLKAKIDEWLVELTMAA